MFFSYLVIINSFLIRINDHAGIRGFKIQAKYSEAFGTNPNPSGDGGVLWSGWDFSPPHKPLYSCTIYKHKDSYFP
jgi:hypothetical protein